MRYLILGSAEARDDDGNPLPLGGPRLRALLTALAMRAARPAPAPVDVLIDELWTDDPPQDAPAALQALVGRLRRAIGRDAVVSSPGGYRLATAGPQDVDLLHFEALTRNGTRALDAGDPGTAAEVLRQALALWRGPALADLPDRDAAAARPEALRMAALHRRIDADLALGRAADVIPELRGLVVDHTLDETLHAQLIRALHASGRTADALAAYETVRRTLADHLGADPGADLKALHGRLLSGEPAPLPAGAGSATVRRPGAAGPTAVGGGRDAGGAYDDRGPGGAAEGAGGGAAEGADGGAAGRRHQGAAVPPGSASAGGPYPAPGPSGAAHDSEGGHDSGGAHDSQGAHAAPAPGVGHARPTAEQPPGVQALAPETAQGPGSAHGGAAPRPPYPGRDEAAPGAPSGGPGPGAPYGRDAADAAAPHTAYAPRDPEAPGPRRPGRPADHALRPAPAGPPPALSPDGGPGTGGGPGAGSRPRGNLRPRLTSFVGRQTEIGDLRRDLGGARLVTLTGPGGSGKTRLSEEAAATVAAAYPDGVWVAELAKLDHAAAVPGAVLSAVGDRESRLLATGLEGRKGGADGADPTARLVELCAHRRLLLLLDNCEHVIDAAARLAETLLAHCPGVTVLATSREPLGVPGETVRPVEPLRPAPAHQLFAERAAATLPGFDPARDPETPAAVAEICRRLDGLPLAIELAAARLRMLTARQIADRLDDRFRLLTSGSRTLLPRQQTLRAVVDWSWELLDERERTVLRRASVFAGGWSLSAAEAVCADASPAADPGVGTAAYEGAAGHGVAYDQAAQDGAAHDGAAHGGAPHDGATYGGAPHGGAPHAGVRASAHPNASGDPGASGPRPRPRIHIAADEVLDLLGALVDKSLLVVDHPTPDQGPDGPAGASAAAPAEVRYRMLETIHEYVGERATEDTAARADHAAAVARHIAHFRDFIRTAEPRLRSAEQLPWLHRVETELDNIRAALLRSLEAGDERTVVEFVRSMSWFWWLRNYRDEGGAWIREALKLGGVLSADDLESVLGSIPEDVPPGQDGVDEAATRYWDQMDLRLMLFFLNADNADGATMATPGFQTAARRIRDAYRDHPGPRAARFPGMLWPFSGFVLGGHNAVLPMTDMAMANCRQYGDDWALGVVMMFRVHVIIDSPGGVIHAEEGWAELRELSRRVGDRWMLAQVETAAGEMATNRGRLDEARAAYRTAQRLAREIGAHTETPFITTRLADVELHAGDLDRAEKLLDLSEEEAERRGTRDVQSFNRLLRALIELRRGDPVRARVLWEEARRVGDQATPPPQFRVVLNGLDARLTAEEGDTPGALRKIRDALSQGGEVGCSEVLLAQQAETAARILVGCGKERLAARLLGAADGWRGELPRTPLPRQEVEKVAAATHRALGREAALALRAEGAGLSVEQVVDLLDAP
ncbi:BTAD domain-containing putative transcriptional regulator [Streptomyces cuspidosporus]|uniref:OmpR/PhoB-type domain-containing protein n=1 Tax=Streptomyces cuspidosporus TaxID=66882 RepID=A0ABN3HC09_9ACTN